ncbi:MAG: hypothetical protein KAS23_14395, partial [Anaerohalosphaera sp.]|nr:hypothetical protein [Anaerohalosphaera sp.]
IKMFTLLLILAFCVPAMAIDVDGTWYTGSKYGTPTLSSTDSNTFTWGTGEAPAVTCATKGSVWSYFQDISLDTVGDKITLDFALIMNDDVTGSNQLRFGLFNDGDIRVENNLPGNNADAGFLNTFGYWVNWPNPGGTVNLLGRTSGATSPVSGTNSTTLSSSGGGPAMAEGVTYTFTFTIIRTTDTQYQISASFDDKTITTITTMIDTTTFNTFSLLNPTTGIGSMTFTDMKVTYNDWAWNPAPASGTVDVELNPTLSWNTGTDPNDPSIANPDITKHYLYGNLADPDDPNLFFIAEIPVATTTYPLAGLLRDTTYKWRIDESVNDSAKDDPATITGMEWTFNTILSVPEIITQPVELYVSPGDEASITVVATNPFTGDDQGLSYQWYRGLPGDTSDPVGTDSATYTIPAAQVDPDEGSYYCIVTLVSNGKIAESDSAALIVKRLFAHWPFDGDATDAANGYDGTEFGTVSYTDGLIGQAIVLDGVDDKVVHAFAQETVWPQFTVSLWAQTADPLQVADTSIFNNNSSSNDFQLDLSGSGSWRYKGSGTGSMAAVDPNTWTMVSVTYDGDRTRIFYNGEYTLYGNFGDNNFGQLAVGMNRGDTKFFNGMIDDLRAYNYALTEIEMALLYTNEMGGEICAEPPTYDLDGDCRVTLSDFAKFAKLWMDCGLVPDCLP